MNIRLVLIAALFGPLHAMAMGFPSFSSEIFGVQLWVLEASAGGLPEEGFEDKHNEFIRYCNGTRSVYVGSSSSPIRCKSEATGGGTYRIRLEAKGEDFSGLVVVSKIPLPNRAKPLPMTAEEVEKLRKAAEPIISAVTNEAKRSYMEYFTETTEVNYVEMLREYKRDAKYRKSASTPFKISSPDGFVYIVSAGLFAEPLGWNIKNVAFREIDGHLQKIGDFWGCIEGFRDLNADGTPEVLTRLCENDEGTLYQFWSLIPTIRPVVTRSQ